MCNMCDVYMYIYILGSEKNNLLTPLFVFNTYERTLLSDRLNDHSVKRLKRMLNRCFNDYFQLSDHPKWFPVYQSIYSILQFFNSLNVFYPFLFMYVFQMCPMNRLVFCIIIVSKGFKEYYTGFLMIIFILVIIISGFRYAYLFTTFYLYIYSLLILYKWKILLMTSSLIASDTLRYPHPNIFVQTGTLF